MSENSPVKLSPWYLNTRRLAILAGIPIGVEAQRSLNENSGERATAMFQASEIATRIALSGGVENLTREVLLNGVPGERVVAAIWGVFSFRGVSRALMREAVGKTYAPAQFSGVIPLGNDDFNFSGKLSNDHFYSDSGANLLSGTKRVFLIGQFQFDGTEVSVHPFIIGDFVPDLSAAARLPAGWPQHARIYPGMLDAFQRIATLTAVSTTKVKELLRIPETKIKEAFAEIIGEPFVPKDWGGEKSDLSTSRLSVDGRPLSAAFIFKGPSVPGELHPANMGKRGDQLGRAFDEPVDLVVIQHCNKIANSVVRQAEALAVSASRPRAYCIIDGADTYRILEVYGRLAVPQDDGEAYDIKRSEGIART